MLVLLVSWPWLLLDSPYVSSVAYSNVVGVVMGFRCLIGCWFICLVLVSGTCIPLAIAGRDICGSAITGPGKTTAFMLPTLERLLYRPKRVPTIRVLIFTPTRELTVQLSMATIASSTACIACVLIAVMFLSPMCVPTVKGVEYVPVGVSRMMKCNHFADLSQPIPPKPCCEGLNHVMNDRPRCFCDYFDFYERLYTVHHKVYTNVSTGLLLASRCGITSNITLEYCRDILLQPCLHRHCSCFS